MCRSIKTLRGIETPSARGDAEAAALQFVRKVSGYRTPSAANREAFDTAVEDVTGAVTRLLDGLVVGRRTPSAAGAGHESVTVE